MSTQITVDNTVDRWYYYLGGPGGLAGINRKDIMNEVWWYEIHCPECGELKRKSRPKQSRICPDCGNPQAICLAPNDGVGLETDPLCD